MKLARLLSLCLLALPVVAQIRQSGFVADPAPTPSSHASTIVEGKAGIFAAWFGGSAEGMRDVCIWFNRHADGRWYRPVIIARGDEDGGDEPWPCWNPVLFQVSNGPLYLFYKVGPSPAKWWGRVKKSDDGGLNWSRSRRLPDGFLGPIRSKPVELPGGTILCGSSTEDQGWRVHMEWTGDPWARAWQKTAPLHAAMELGAIQPTILQWPEGRLQILCRTKEGLIYDSESTNRGLNWTRMRRTTLPNPNSGIEGLVLKERRALLVYNPTAAGRNRLVMALSEDGQSWRDVLTLEDTAGAEFSYPAMIQDKDGLVHVTYTWNRERIKHVVLDPIGLR